MGRPRHKLAPAILFAGPTLFAFVMYWWTLAPDLTWDNFGGDGGELITAAVTLGVPHPPGYPTYVLLGKLVSLLPWGTVAYRFHLFSAVCMALAVGGTAVFCHSFLPQPGQKQAKTLLAAVAAALLLAFSPLLWAQALIAEVYALNLLVVVLLLLALRTDKPPLLVGLLSGLALTTHLTSLLLLPLPLLLRPRSQWRRWLSGLLLGLLPLALIPIFARGNSPVVWGEPTTLVGWWWLVSGRLYQPNLQLALPTDWATRLLTLATQFSWAGLLLLGWGLAQKRVNWRWPGTAVLLLSSPFFYQTSDALTLALPGLMLLTPLLAQAFFTLPRLLLILPLASLLLNFPQQNLHQSQRLVRQQAQPLLVQLPPNAIVETPGDATIFALWYFKFVEGDRADITIVDQNLFAFDWYRTRLQQRHPHLRAVAEDDLLRFKAANQPNQPYCFMQIAVDTASVMRCDEGSL